MRLLHIKPLDEGARFLLVLENGEELRCGPREVMELNLIPGMELDPDALAELRDACEAYGIRVKAAEQLSRRAMSARELERRLREKGASPEHAEAAVRRMTELGVIDEAVYAEMIVRRCGTRGYGRRRAEQELMRHQVPREYWAEALESLPAAEDKLDALIAARLKGTVPDGEQRKKLAAYLQRRGYSWEEISSALRRWAAEPED
ncbi:MAG: regulatory protein RecX [Oscillospiraceae bacterium]|nr:regulatory protein RecX [Oscillospiraceae bacterium]